MTMVRYILPIMTIALLSHMTSIPSSAAAPQNYVLPSIPLLRTSSREASLSPSSSSSTEDEKSYFVEENDSSTSSWEDSSGTSGGKQDPQARTPVGGGGPSLLLTSRIRIGDDTSSSIVNSDEDDDIFPYTREFHDSSVYHLIPNFLEKAERPRQFRLEVEGTSANTRNTGINQLTGNSLQAKDEDTFPEDNSRSFNGFSSQSLWNIPTIPKHLSNSNHPIHNGVGKRNIKRFNENTNHLYGIQDNYGEPTTFTRNEKRSPRCLRRCLAQGLLHPSQCHSLC